MHTIIETPLGEMYLTSSNGERLSGAYFAAQKHFPRELGELKNTPIFNEARAQIDAWFKRRTRSFMLDLQPEGSAFQAQVWQQIASIPYAQSRRYGELAASLGRPQAARAVGAATGRNPLSIIVPCHRVLGANGALTGYAGGIERKSALLHWEQSG